MTAFAQEELSLVLDALLRTVLESRYGRGCWKYLSTRRYALLNEVRRILGDRDMWLDIARHMSLSRDSVAGLRREQYLDRVATLFAERAVYGFRLPALRVDPEPWNSQAIDRWRNGRSLLAILTGHETIPIVETVKAIQTNRIGIDASGHSVVGVPEPAWVAETGSAGGGVVLGEDGEARWVEFDQPVRIEVALILGLPRRTEIDLHHRLTQEARAAGVTVLNPASAASEVADRKHLAHTRWHRAGLATPAWRFLPGACSRDAVRQALLAISGQWAAGGRSADGRSVYILPDRSTEGDRVRRFPLSEEDLVAASAYIEETIHPMDDALIRQECGNVRLLLDGAPRRAVFRLNVSAASDRTCTFSGCWQVAGDQDEDVASVGRGGTLLGWYGTQECLVAAVAGEWTAVPAGAWNETELAQLGQQALGALQRDLPSRDRLRFVGLDLLPAWRPGDGSIRWLVLEANARPAGLGAMELIGA